jgi:DNA-binding HxlR family transcriptional regulator
MKKTKTQNTSANRTECQRQLMAINDALDIIRGKWKIQIIGTLTFGTRRFKELQREVTGVTARMLSKELRDLEMNQLVIRTVHHTIPVTVEYALTEYGKTLEHVIEELRVWGLQHRKRIIKKAV